MLVGLEWSCVLLVGLELSCVLLAGLELKSCLIWLVGLLVFARFVLPGRDVLLTGLDSDNSPGVSLTSFCSWSFSWSSVSLLLLLSVVSSISEVPFGSVGSSVDSSVGSSVGSSEGSSVGSRSVLSAVSSDLLLSPKCSSGSFRVSSGELFSGGIGSFEVSWGSSGLSCDSFLVPLMWVSFPA